MSKNNASRMPVRFIPGNEDLLKSQVGTASPGPGWAGQRPGDEGGTDYIQEESVYHVGAGVLSSYRTPAGRVNGNELFRRYPNGMLDVTWAMHQVIEALHRAKQSAGHDQLNSMEKVALSVLFPQSFGYVAPGMVIAVATVQLRLSPLEIIQIREAVARHIGEEANWNSGLGGGSVPGRHVTKHE